MTFLILGSSCSFIVFPDLSRDPIARKMRLRRGRRDQEEADQDQAKILKVSSRTYSLMKCFELSVSPLCRSSYQNASFKDSYLLSFKQRHNTLHATVYRQIVVVSKMTNVCFFYT